MDLSASQSHEPEIRGRRAYKDVGKEQLSHMRALLASARRQQQDAASEHRNKAQRSHDESLVSSVCEPRHTGDGPESNKSERDVEQNCLELVKAKVFNNQAAKYTEAAGWDAVDVLASLRERYQHGHTQGSDAWQPSTMSSGQEHIPWSDPTSRLWWQRHYGWPAICH